MTDQRWRKARASQPNGNCVELSNAGDIRDSKNPGRTLGVNVAASLVAHVKADPDRLSSPDTV